MSDGFMETKRIESLCQEYAELKREVNENDDVLSKVDQFRIESWKKEINGYLGVVAIPEEFNREIIGIFNNMNSSNRIRMLEIRNEISNLALGESE